MPVAWARARRKRQSRQHRDQHATSRRILVSLPWFGAGDQREQVPSRRGIVRPDPDQNSTARPFKAARESAESEADAAVRPPGSRSRPPAEFGEWCQVTLHLERGAAEQVQPASVLDHSHRPPTPTRARCSSRRRRTVAARSGQGRGPVRDVAVDLPEVNAGAGRRTAREVVVERDDRVEWRLGKQRLEPNTPRPPIPKSVSLASRAELRTTGLCAGRRAAATRR